jgi:predicted DNA binding CopG/RHH family protein
VEGRRREKSVKHIPDSQIDFSEVPELSDAELSKGKRVGRPKSSVVKQMIALRIDPALLSRLKKLAKKKKIPYQTLLHELLEEAVRDAA